MGEIIDGRAVAKRVRSDVARRVRALADRGIVPGLHVVLAGDHPPSRIYVAHKEKACLEVGIRSAVHRLPRTSTLADVIGIVERLNQDPDCHAILVQLPLPEGVRSRPVLAAVLPSKDADGFHPFNMGYVATGRPDLAPCTPKGVMRVLREYDVPIRGAHAVVIGRSRVVGRPMAALLLAADATVTTCHRHTQDAAQYTRQADIVVVATGIPHLVKADWVKPGAVVVDVGISRSADGTLVGDVDFDNVLPKARLVTPVPGGIGPMTIAMLLENTCILAERAADLADAGLPTD